MAYTTFLPNDIILEILKRLPAKSLMRFKCVSKGWLNMILHPFFIESHQNHARARPDASRRLFAYSDRYNHLVFSYHNNDHPELLIQTFFSTNMKLDFTSSQILYSQSPLWLGANTRITSECQGISNIANGLICVHIYGVGCPEKQSLWLINLATMQKRSLPIPRVCFLHRSSYFLGSDSSSKKYKILHFCSGGEYDCQVLTVGRRRWRRVIGRNPGKELGLPEAMSTDGRIYFKVGNRDLHVLTFFDLHTEKFAHLSIPEASLPREGNTGWLYCPYYLQELFEIRGKLGLVRGLKVWILEETDWIEKSIILPNHVYNGTFVGYERNSKIIIKSSQGGDMTSKYFLCDLDTSECVEAPGIAIHDLNFSNYLFGSPSDVCNMKLFNYIENITTL
ncbi:unnamed protein product [Cuscuta epithymum]|uniref:F-box domain-containing protein n=1 Tax=Cuscuta epithymum TaxID=186058 RepID=A0AAV0F435_9ASTE|nr:unnamed protein product [Cuscuta epithymum]